MTYSVKDLRIPNSAHIVMERVLSYLQAHRQAGRFASGRSGGIHSRDAHPVVFGPYVVCCLLGKPLPDMMDVVADLATGHEGIPNGWSCISDHGEMDVPLLDWQGVLTMVGYYKVPNVPATVRLYRTTQSLTAKDVAPLYENGSGQVVYDERKTVFTPDFKLNLEKRMVSISQLDTLTKERRQLVQERAKALASRLGFVGVGVIRPRTPVQADPLPG